MLKLDHLTIPVSNWNDSRDWYVGTLGLTVEFEVPCRKTVAVQDQNDFTVFLVESRAPLHAEQFALTFQVSDVEASFEEFSRRGASFAHAPARVLWGYGAELRDPDGYVIRLWDARSMQAKG